MRNVTWVNTSADSAYASVLSGYLTLAVKRPIGTRGGKSPQFQARVGDVHLPGRWETKELAQEAAESVFATLLKDAAKLYQDKE